MARPDVLLTCLSLLNEEPVRLCLERAGVDLTRCTSPLLSSSSLSSTSSASLVHWLEGELSRQSQRLLVVDGLLRKALDDDVDRGSKLEGRRRGLKDAIEIIETLLSTLNAPSSSRNEEREGEIAVRSDQVALKMAKIEAEEEAEGCRAKLKRSDLVGDERTRYESRLREVEAACLLYSQMLASMAHDNVPAQTIRPADVSAMVAEATSLDAAQQVAVKKAEEEAELNLTRKLLTKEKKRGARQAAASEVSHNKSEDLLQSLLNDENKRAAKLEGGLQSAESEFQMKLAKGKGRKTKTNQLVSNAAANNMCASDVKMTGSASAEEEKLFIAEQTPFYKSSTYEMEESANTDSNFVAMMQRATAEKEAQELATKRAADQAELDLLRKLMMKKANKVSDAERLEMEKRERALQEAVGLSDSMLLQLQQNELMHTPAQTSADKSANLLMQEKLLRGKQKKSLAQPAVPLNENIFLTNKLLASVVDILEMDTNSNVEMVKQVLNNRNIQVNIECILGALSESEAARKVAAQMNTHEHDLSCSKNMLSRETTMAKERVEISFNMESTLLGLDILDNWLQQLLDEERKKWAFMSEEEKLTSDALREKLANRKLRRQAQNSEPSFYKNNATDVNQLVSDNDLVNQVLSGLVHRHLDVDASSLSSMTVAEVGSELIKKGVDIDMESLLATLATSEAAKHLATKRAADQAELEFLQKLLKKSNQNSVLDNAEFEKRKAELESAMAAGEVLMNQLVLEQVKQASIRSQEEDAAQRQMLEKIRKRKQTKIHVSSTGSSAMVCQDLTQKVDDNAVVSIAITSLAIEHLLLDQATLNNMTFEEVSDQLKAKGVDVDVTALLRKVAAEEATKSIAARRAADQAELDFVRKLLRKQGSKIDAAELHELKIQEQALEQALLASDALLQQFDRDEQQRRAKQLSAEEFAQQKLFEKLSRGKRKQTTTQNDIMLLADNKVVLNELLANFATTLNTSSDDLSLMSVGEIQQRLQTHGIEIDITTMLRAATEAQASKQLAAKRAADEAELDLIRKVLARKFVTESERRELLLKEQALVNSVQLVDYMLDSLLDDERKRWTNMSEEERKASDQLQERLLKSRRKQKCTDVTSSNSLNVEEYVIECPLHSQIIANIVAIHAPDLTPEQLQTMTLADVQDELEKRGSDIDLLEMLRSLNKSEVAKQNAVKRAADQAELDFIRKLLKGKKLTVCESEELRKREEMLLAALETSASSLEQFMSNEKQRQMAQAAEEKLAQQRLLEKLQKARARKRIEGEGKSIQDNLILKAELLSVIASHLDMNAIELVSMTPNEIEKRLASKGITIDIEAMMRAATDNEASRQLATKRVADEADLRMIRKMLAKQNLTSSEREQLLKKEQQLQDSLALSDALLEALLSEEQKRWGHMTKEQQIVNEQMRERLARNRKKKELQTLETTSDDKGPMDASSVLSDSALLMHVLVPLAQDLLQLSAEQLATMQIEYIQTQLSRNGVDIDILALLRDLTDSEAGRMLASKQAAAEAELDFLRRMLNNKNKKLSPAEQQALLDREKELIKECDLYNKMLDRLREEQRRRQGLMTLEEQRAYDAMMEKLRRGKQKKQRGESHTPPPADFSFDPNEQVIGAHAELLDVLQPLARAHLDFDDAEIAAMTVNELQQELRKQGCDIDIMEMLRNLADSEAAKILAQRRAAMQAEADLFRKMLTGKKLTPQQRQDMEDRIAELDMAIENYDQLLNKLLEHELRHIQYRRAEQERADQDMRARLAKRTKKEASQKRPASSDMNKNTPNAAHRRAAAREDAERIYDHLVSNATARCPRCNYVNRSFLHACGQCKLMCDFAPIMMEEQLCSYHRRLHACQIPTSLVKTAMMQIGPVKRHNFIDIMELLTVQCSQYHSDSDSVHAVSADLSFSAY